MAAGGLARQDLLELETLPAYQVFIKVWRQAKSELIASLAYDAALDSLARAEKVGRLKEIDEVLTWLDRQLGRSKAITE